MYPVVCAEPGSTSTFISGDQAQGVTSGGWGDGGNGSQTWYQPGNEILYRYGLSSHAPIGVSVNERSVFVDALGLVRLVVDDRAERRCPP